MLGFYIGGMGAKKKNFHKDHGAHGLRGGGGARAAALPGGQARGGALAVPDPFADEISLVGPRARIRERTQAWRGTPVTSLIVMTRDPAVLRLMADVVA